MISKRDNFYKKKLENGLTVLFDKRNLPIVSTSASVNYGAAFEPLAKKGISHCIEHMMFKGTKKRSQKEIVEEIERKGGIINAFTSEEVTSYWNKLASKFLDSGLDIASDLILNPRFDEKEFEKEKKVIIEEIKMHKDVPQYYVIDKIKEMLYESPFGASMAGDANSVNSLKIGDLKKLFDEVYTTDSIILSVVGDVDFEDICKKAELFPARKRKILDYQARKINKEEIEKRKGIDQSHFVLGFHVPCLCDKRKYDYEVMKAYLLDGMSSVLFQEVREKLGLVYHIKGDFDIGKNYGYAMIYAGALKENLKKIKEIIIKEIKNIKNIKSADFGEVKEQLIGMKKIEAEDSTNTMNNLMLEEVGCGAEEYYNYEARINGVKIEDVKNIKIKDFSSFSLVSE